MKLTFLKKDKSVLSQPIVLFMINFTLLFVGYYMFFWRTITADATTFYVVGDYGKEFSFDKFLSLVAGGRWLAGVIGYLQSLLKINWYENQWVAQLIKEIVCAIIPIRIAFLFKREDNDGKSNVFLLNLLFLMCTLNVYIEEMFAYNTLEICFGWWLAFEAAILFCKERYLWAGILTFISLSSYQVNYCIVVIIGMAWLLRQNGYVYSKKIFKKCVYLLLVVLIPSILNILLPVIAINMGWTNQIVKTTIFDTANAAETVGFLTNMKRMAGFVFAFLFTSAQGMMPYGMIAAFLILLYVIYYLSMKRQGETVATRVWSLLYVSVFFVSCYAIGFIQSIVSLPPRVLYGLFTGMAMLVYIVYNYTKNDAHKQITKYATGLLGAVMFVCIIICGIDHHTSNELDIALAKLVQNEIDQYEQETGERITDIHFYYDDPNDYEIAYSDFMIHHYFVQSYNNSVFTTSWGAVNMVGWIADRIYDYEEMDPTEYKRIFGQTRWDRLDLNKQILFDGSTMYWAIYLD